MPYTKVILGPAYSVRLVDLQASDCVFARCMYCRKVWRIATHRLYDRFPPHESLPDEVHEVRNRCRDELARAAGVVGNPDKGAPKPAQRVMGIAVAVSARRFRTGLLPIGGLG